MLALRVPGSALQLEFAAGIAAPFVAFQIGFDIFLLIHLGLHRLFRHHPHNAFGNRFSQALILGAAPLALLHLALIVGG